MLNSTKNIPTLSTENGFL